MKKTLSFLLAILLLLSTALVGCKKNNVTDNDTTQEETTLENTTPDKQPENTIPTKTLTSVALSAGDSATELLAATELQKHLEIKGVTISGSGLPINLSIDETLGTDCYRIEGAANVTEEQNGDEYVNIIGGNGRAVFYGVVRFLEDFAGTRFFTYEL